jgi:hypothetical protein
MRETAMSFLAALLAIARRRERRLTLLAFYLERYNAPRCYYVSLSDGG